MVRTITTAKYCLPDRDKQTLIEFYIRKSAVRTQTRSKAQDRRNKRDEVHSKAPGVRGVRFVTSGSPFRTESHPHNRRRYTRFQGIRIKTRELSTPVKFSGGQNDDPVVHRRVILDKLTDDVAT